MSGKGYDSSNSSEGKDKFGLSPHLFEPERSQVKVENLVNGLEFYQKIYSPEINTSWKHRLV